MHDGSYIIRAHDYADAAMAATVSCRSSKRRLFSSTVPTVIRRQSLQCSSLPRNRTTTPLSAMRLYTSCAWSTLVFDSSKPCRRVKWGCQLFAPGATVKRSYDNSRFTGKTSGSNSVRQSQHLFYRGHLATAIRVPPRRTQNAPLT